MIIIGYSGHAYVVCDVLESMNLPVTHYCDTEEKKLNPYSLIYLGAEDSHDAVTQLNLQEYFVAIGSNKTRLQVYEKICDRFKREPINAIHSSAKISAKAKLNFGILAAPSATVNSMAIIGKGAILNTGSIVEHECFIGEFTHICPGTVLAGNVKIGSASFIGANSVVKQGVNIGDNVIVGAGSVVITDIPDNVCVVGNPARIVKSLS